MRTKTVILLLLVVCFKCKALTPNLDGLQRVQSKTKDLAGTVIVESAKPLDIPIQTKDQANSAALQAPPSAQTQPAVNNNLNVNLGDVNLNSIGRSDNKNYGEFSQNLQKVPLSGS
ncbi:hypothetical protein RR46_05252 [Papilio xuthus]|uniref:Cuticular protein n=1 Tax=Papilio xuthus TaxID=66420 RepID=A0A194Q625_PAPXU|nr:hypothetical protein RR46_05252 [Papilio xuthus]